MLNRIHNNPQLTQAPNIKSGEINLHTADKPSHRRRRKSSNHLPRKTSDPPQFKIHIGTSRTAHAETGTPVADIEENKGQRHTEQNTSKISELERANKKLEEDKLELELQLAEKKADKIMERLDNISSTIQQLTTRMDLLVAETTIREQADKISELTKKIWQQKPM